MFVRQRTGRDVSMGLADLMASLLPGPPVSLQSALVTLPPPQEGGLHLPIPSALLKRLTNDEVRTWTRLMRLPLVGLSISSRLGDA